MSVREPHETINLAELYHEDLMPWDRALQALGAGSLGPEIPCFLGTVRPDGRPHSAGIGIAEHDGYLYFTSGPQTQKSRNLIQNASCTLSLRLDGIDVIFEGDAQRVVDRATLEQAVAQYDRVLAAQPHSIEAVNKGLEASVSEGLLIEASLFGICAGSEDKKEGTSAFLEKRAPQFHGR